MQLRLLKGTGLSLVAMRDVLSILLKFSLWSTPLRRRIKSQGVKAQPDRHATTMLRPH